MISECVLTQQLPSILLSLAKPELSTNIRTVLRSALMSSIICDVSSVQKFSCFGKGIQVSGLTLTEFCLCEVTVYSRRLLQAFVVCMGMILMKISFWSQQYTILYMIYTLIYQDTLVICTMSHCDQEYTSREYKNLV